MKTHPAIAVVEFSEIPAGAFATDAMLKKAPIASVRAGTVTHGRYLTIIGGTPAAVAEALAAGLYCGGESVLDHVFLADVHAQLYEGILGARMTGAAGALAILETDTVAATVRAAEAALKGTPVQLVEVRLADAGLAGKGISVYRGELHDIEAAVGLALAAVGPERRVTHRIIPAPHEALASGVDQDTRFAAATPIDLDGESG